MPKGAGRKTFEKGGTTTKSAAAAVATVDTISPEDAERAAAAFVPLWEFDEALFEVGAKVSEDDLSLLAAPVAPVLAPAASLKASPPASAEELAPKSSRHTPLAAHPDDPPVPSVVIAGGDSPANGTPAAPVPPVVMPAESVVLAAGIAAAPAVPPPAPPASVKPLGEPLHRTSAPVRALPAPRPTVTSDAMLYRIPRRRSPALAALAVAGSAVIVMAIYFVSTAMSAPAPVVATVPIHAPPEPKVNIPPPPPPDEAVATPAPARSAVSARVSAPSVPSPVTPPPPAPVIAPPRAAPAPPAVVWHPAAPHPAARPAAGKNPSPSSHPGDIVRDNPF